MIYKTDVSQLQAAVGSLGAGGLGAYVHFIIEAASAGTILLTFVTVAAGAYLGVAKIVDRHRNRPRMGELPEDEE